VARKKLKWTGITVALILAMLVSACGGGNTKQEGEEKPPRPSNEGDASTESELPFVELSYYYPTNTSNVKDLALVEAEMNKILKQEINAHIKLNPIDFGAYGQKMNMMNSAGDKYDLAFVSNWLNDYYQNVSKGALIPLDDLMKAHAPKLTSSIPDSVWNGARVEGKIYGSINLQIYAMPYGPIAFKEMVDKYNLDLSKVKSLRDLEPYLASWEDSHNRFLPNQAFFTSAPPYFGFDSIGEVSSVGWVKLNDENLQVVNQFESNEFKETIETLRDFLKKGYIPADAPLITEEMMVSEIQAGRMPLILGLNGPVKPGVEAEEWIKYKRDVVYTEATAPLVTTDRIVGTMTGISRTSSNPERAMMFLEQINTNKKLYDLITNGIEGKHYTIVDEANGVIKKMDDSGYGPNADWVYGNQFNAYYTDANNLGIWEKTQQMNATAAVSPLLGFAFNPEPIKSELAQVGSVWSEYMVGFMTGTYDLDKVYPAFLEKLNKAGAAKVIAEKQSQIDAWKASR